MTTTAILLGTDGGPRPKATRHAPASLIVHNNALFVVDCGNGVAGQIVRAGYELHRLRASFITHHHCDHNIDYGTLLLLAWTAGLATPIDTFGPPPLSAMTRQFIALNAHDLEIRVSDEGRPPLPPLITPHELTQTGLVYDADGLRVSALRVHHPPVRDAFAYRFDTEDRSIVFSGDTAYSPELIEFSRGADTLVHEAMLVDALDNVLTNNNGSTLIDHLLASHTPADLAGSVAEQAGVPKLVLNHFVPGSDAVSDQTWHDEAARHYSGTVLVGQDLMKI